ncbi:WbqC family protein [Campylobacterota bacterium DY0563]
MTVAIMQPYFFPYIGYWQLIANSDEFIFFDIVQYNKRSWMNRNRILHPDKPNDFQYISVPIKKHSQGTIIKEVTINNNENWKAEILGKLSVYKKLKAPYYNETISIVRRIFDKEYENFLNLSVEITKQICAYLEIDFKYKIASEIDFDKNSIKGPGDWALYISKKLKAKQYINPYGGYELFEENKYLKNGIELKFIKPNLSPYKQSWREEFINGLSIIDILMFNDKDTIMKILSNDYKILNKQELEKENEL